MLEVAVIGAGASALAASRHLIGQGLRPSIFEAARTLGGSWSTSSYNSVDGKMWEGLTTNLSKYTCRFSEWPWPDETPTFPSAIDMGRYLDSYADHFLDPTCFQYQCQVTNIESSIHGRGYRVEWTDLTTSAKHSKEFEGVVLATGFFAKPYFPHSVMATKYSNDLKLQTMILHASEYKSSRAFADQSVAVVGGSFSALEIAVDVAKTAKRVVHVVPPGHVPWVLPRHIPDNKSSTSSTCILPVDLALYQRSQDAPQLPERTEMTPELSRLRHQYMYSLVGKRQESSPLGIPNDWDEPPVVAISDYYLDLIIQGDIEVIHGRFQGPADEDHPSAEGTTWQLESTIGYKLLMNDIDKVICATGYTSNLDDYLSPDILQLIDYDPSDLFCPMTTCWDTFHPRLPNLFFCGMYRGPYMGIMELQGRLAAGMLSGNVTLDDTTMEKALEQSRHIRHGQSRRAQFPHFDYLGYMDTLASVALQDKTFPTHNTRKGDMVSPAFYQSTDPQLASDEAADLQKEMERGKNGNLIPNLALSAIIGEWNFDRRIVHIGEDRKDHVYGTVKYSRPSLDHVLYREDGFYELSPSKTLNVFREYEYQVRGDCLELYFVENGERAHLFLSLQFTQQEGDYWVATSDHLCIQDLYKARFEIQLDGLAATHLRISYRVQGPTKDYESTTILTPKSGKALAGIL